MRIFHLSPNHQEDMVSIPLAPKWDLSNLYVAELTPTVLAENGPKEGSATLELFLLAILTQ